MFAWLRNLWGRTGARALETEARGLKPGVLPPNVRPLKPRGWQDLPTKALADRQTDELPGTDRLGQPVVAHQDRRRK